MKTRIFLYNGALGAVTDLKQGNFLNDINSPGQLGCVIDTNEVVITKKAKEFIKTKATRESGSFAELMLTRHSKDNSSSVGITGFGKHFFGSSVAIGRDCDLSVLDDCIEVGDEIIPSDFKEFVDSRE